MNSYTPIMFLFSGGLVYTSVTSSTNRYKKEEQGQKYPGEVKMETLSQDNDREVKHGPAN